MSEVKTTSLATFARQMKAWRTQLKWTQVDTADKLGYSASLISGIETMDKNPTADFAASCDRVFGLPGTFADLQALVAREAYPAWFAPVVPFEQEATRIHGWELGAVPGLLQTADYARAQIRSGRPQDSAEAIERLVAVRIERQAILTKDQPPMLWYVIDEGVLRHMVGGPAVMTAQLDKLIDLSAMPGIVIQVLAFDGDNYAGSDGPISVYDFAVQPTVCYTECYAGGRVVEARDEVDNLVTVLGLIRASALSPLQSLSLIHQIRSEIDE